MPLNGQVLVSIDKAGNVASVEATGRAAELMDLEYLKPTVAAPDVLNILKSI